MSLFLLTFFLICGSAHAYVYSKARAAFGFGWQPSLAAIPVLAALCCGPLIVFCLGDRKLERASRVASWLVYTWMGLLFFFTWTNLALGGVKALHLQAIDHARHTK